MTNDQFGTGACLMKIDAFGPSKALGDQASLVPFNGAISPGFDLINPFASYGSFPGRKRLNRPSAILL
ncbi:hypothetical protein CDL15_Pgr019539 [Punica granatum]|uniref:Uncharacterized protein n=1 Tax=Punica granatum TaxID=22663 RepID=A0A218X6B6_PUNGR|nr:hypothetical protein CDL15_Pgr019539 [Punica granatum]